MYKLVAEQRLPSQDEVGLPAAPIPMHSDRYDQVLREMHEAKLKELQMAHDAALYEVQRLRQKQESGKQQHMVVNEKRQLALLISKNQRLRKQFIRKMIPHVKYIMDKSEHQIIPNNWKKLATEGNPYWVEPVEQLDDTPCTSEKNSIVESYLRRQHAWEQVTEILPRETQDAMNFFAGIENEARAFMESMSNQETVQVTSTEMIEYNVGCWVLCKDVLVKARACQQRCHDVWNRIGDALQSDEILAVTKASGDGGGVPSNLKVDAMVPFLPVSHQAINEQIMRDDRGKAEQQQRKVPAVRESGPCSIVGCTNVLLHHDHPCRTCGYGVHNLCAQEKGLKEGDVDSNIMYCSLACKQSSSHK